MYIYLCDMRYIFSTKNARKSNTKDTKKDEKNTVTTYFHI